MVHFTAQQIFAKNILQKFLGPRNKKNNSPSAGPCCWHCSLCWCTSDSSVTCSNQISMVKNIYLDIKINLLQCQRAELHLKVALDHVVGIGLGVGVHLTVLWPVPINSAWSKTYIWTSRSTFYDARKFLRCLETDIHLEWVLEHVVGIVVDLGLLS